MTLSALRWTVILRDGGCVIAQVVDRAHVCQDRYGQVHPATELDSLTLGHVREHPGGKRRDEEGWCIAQCARSNLEHMESADAAVVRAYLAGVRAGLEHGRRPA